MTESVGHLLVLGVGNLLMGDEGVGVHVIRYLEKRPIPPGVELLDGGTGSFLLLDPMQRASKVILIDATVDGQPSGTITRVTPRFSSDYPPTLTAHDIGLKDLLDAFYLLGCSVEMVLIAVSIKPLQQMGLTLSPEIAAQVPTIGARVMEEISTTLASV